MVNLLLFVACAVVSVVHILLDFVYHVLVLIFTHKKAKNDGE